MRHLILLGDSIFDNERYVPGGPAVIDHLQKILPPGWTATLLARDGAGLAELPRQLELLPADATHLVVSIGGNDVLDLSGTIRLEAASSVVEALNFLAELREEFQSNYRAMLHSLSQHRRAVTVCTIYDAVPGLERMERTALCLFNDVILREAFRAEVPIIDLRLVCTEATDYAKTSPIEPSVIGGSKIAAAVVRAISNGEFVSPGVRVFK